MNISQLFIKRPVMTYIVMGVILLMGLFAFKKLPVTDLPNVDYPVFMVQTSYSGASPEVMARTVTSPIEKELININGIKHVTSQSGRGFSWITILFELNKNMDEAAQDVQAALKRAEGALPRDLDETPSYSKANAHQESIIYLVLMAARGLTFEELHRAVGNYTGNPPLGVLDAAGRKFTLEVPGQLKSAAEFRDLLIKEDVRLKDVADVFDGLESD